MSLIETKRATKVIAEQLAEIARLQIALLEIRDYPEEEDGRLDSMEAIARDALEGE